MMDELFEQNGIDVWDIDFEAENPTVETKPHHSALEVASWLRQRGVYGTLLKKATKLVKSIRKLVVQGVSRLVPCDEPLCNGGTYGNPLYNRTCFRCKGTGEYNLDAQARYEASRKRKDKKTWRDYKNPDYRYAS